MALNRPWIHLNAALDSAGDHCGAISCREDLVRVHALRERYDGVAIGGVTHAVDHPRLSARPEFLGRPALHQPLRLVLSGHEPIVDDVGGAPLFAFGPTAPRRADHWVPCPARDIEAASAGMARLGLRSVLLEGGPTIWRAALDCQVVDLLTIWVKETSAERAEVVVRKRFCLPALLNTRTSTLGSGQLVRVVFTTPTFNASLFH